MALKYQKLDITPKRQEFIVGLPGNLLGHTKKPVEFVVYFPEMTYLSLGNLVFLEKNVPLCKSSSLHVR